MRIAAITLVLVVSAAAESPREVHLLNVELVDRTGTQTSLVGFHRVSGEDRFQGYLGAGEIEVPYARIRELRIEGAPHPGARMRVHIVLRSGKEVAASFDEREGDQLFSGFASFGRVRIFFRDIRHLRFVGRTSRADLPSFGAPGRGVDVRVLDREGVVTELLHFRRAGSVENTLPGLRGATSVAIPMRILARCVLTPGRSPMSLTVTLKSGETVKMKLPTYEEESVYAAEAEFGVFRIRLGRVLELEVHRVTPPLRELDPVAAAKGQQAEEGAGQR